MNIRILQCGNIRVSETVSFGNRIDLRDTARQLMTANKDSVKLPVFTFLIEHPMGLILVDTGWCREISPEGIYDANDSSTNHRKDDLILRWQYPRHRPFYPRMDLC